MCFAARAFYNIASYASSRKCERSDNGGKGQVSRKGCFSALVYSFGLDTLAKLKCEEKSVDLAGIG